MTDEELKARMDNLKPLDVKSASEVADSAFKASETKPVLETVNTKPDPELTPSVSFIEAISGWIMAFAKQETTNQFEGKPVANPFAPVSFLALNWKWLAIGAAVLVVLYLVVRFVL